MMYRNLKHKWTSEGGAFSLLMNSRIIFTIHSKKKGGETCIHVSVFKCLDVLSLHVPKCGSSR